MGGLTERILRFFGFRRVEGLPPDTANLTHIYRYRSADAVLERFEELEKQEIYFSTPEELNDPIEGFKDLFWSGDEIVWRNLFRHYVFCLLDTTYHIFTTGTEFDPKYVEQVAMSAPDSLPDAPIREIYKRLSDSFINDPAVKAVIALVSNREEPVRRSELMGYLRPLHPLVLTPLLEDLHARGLWKDFIPPPKEQAEKLRENAIKLVAQMQKLPGSEKGKKRVSDAIFAAGESIYAQLQLIAEANMPDRKSKKPITFLGGRFPSAYLAALDKLVHYNWYVACFTNRPDNHSMWSTYADGHRGVCLKFKTSANSAGAPCLTVEKIIGGGGTKDNITYTSGWVPHEIKPVKYSTTYPAIDFFRSLGTVRQMYVDRFWYGSDDGRFSVCRAAMCDDQQQWHKDYWSTFADSTLRKTPEWAAEEEYRVTTHSMLFDMSEKKARKLKYRFEDLAGIIFGLRTDAETKLKIMKIIERKCAASGRSDFNFYEVRYSPDDTFRVFELSLIKIEPPSAPIRDCGAC